MRALEAAGVAYELVPGVSSALAAPAAAGIPVTDRGAAEGVTIVTGHRRADHPEPVPVLPAYVAERTVVVLMGLGSLRQLVEGALAIGYPTDLPAAVVSKATLPEQRTVAARLAELPGKVEEAGLETPATIVIGWVAARAVEKTNCAAEAIAEEAAGLVPAGRSVAARAAGR